MDIQLFAVTLLVLSVSLVIGKYLRLKIVLLQKLFLPSSVIGGLFLLFIGPYALSLPVLRDLTGMWALLSVLPAYLINIIFASLFIGKDLPPLKEIWRLSGPQVCFGQTLAWGQYLFGILAGIFVLTPLLGLPPIAGALIEIGFEGGHGTAAGLGPTFEALGWPQGQDLALGLATVGIMVGVLAGIVLVNWASRKNIIKERETVEILRREDTCTEFEDREEVNEEKGFLPESIEPLSLHLALVGAAVGIGYLMLELLIYLEGLLFSPFGWEGIMEFVPLFPLAMIGGILVQILYHRLFENTLEIDRQQINRLQGLSLDFLIVASLGSLSLGVLVDYWEAMVLLSLIGITWNLTAFLFLAPRLIKHHWFERGIGDLGQSMGMTATGLLLIRLADPDNRSNALEAFGYKQLLFEPIVGGGLFTAASMPLIARLGAHTMLFFVAVIFLFWLVVGFMLRKRI
ncbi:sodium/glutamate symporter [Candidatus Contubernalis alkaliaceticus]|uniref:sodium/glutamate symporter n=1 Tax=Candidatus Contubernalis alkaliaceticus TaxID=338645 RepID=UPI001F4BCFA1|nr:sodium/glutamate symporter [Candidatus Contubernalis alkalaceticus]UNC91393.1 sodium:glutamate symporter [Candidatus Contubernalis alkalaceticus]